MPKVVDEYVLSIEDIDGFKTVIIKLKMADGSVETFAFAPPFAHRLSDELCVTSVRAAGRSTGETVLPSADGSA